MDYATAESKLKDLKSKAKAARKDGKRDAAQAFAAGARRIQRKLRSIPKPTPEPSAEAEGEG
ncbi:MAG: hypothetical protein AAFU77_13050 [Myxococcota bacterium]